MRNITGGNEAIAYLKVSGVAIIIGLCLIPLITYLVP